MAWSLLLRGGSVIDGSGSPARRADVAVEGDRIAAIGPDLRGEAGRTLDVTGHVVAPGFIDMHSHSDLFYFACPSAESKVRQGVTTEVVGMCSFSQAPLRADQLEIVRGWAGGIGASLDLPWETFAQYLDALRAIRPSVNVAHFVGHGALRIAAMGFEARPAGADDVRVMQRLLGEAMDAGAFGFSTGLVYAPSAYSNTEELIALAREMAPRGGYYFSHIRGESSMLLDSISEAIRIGEEAGVAVQVSHVKASGRENWPKIDAALRLFDTARARGVDVAGDVYPYNAGSTKLDNMMPAWAHEGGIGRLLERLADRAMRRRIIEECLIDGERWGTVSQGGIGFDQVFIASCRRRELEGLSLAQIASQSGRPPAEALLNLLLEEKCTVGMVSFSQSIEIVAKVLAHPALMIGSDSIPLYEGQGERPGKPHPRTYGTFPRVLGEYARERRLFSLETAVHKMTGMAAARIGLRDRGLVHPGYVADLAVFDPATVKDEATYPDPHRYPTGIPYVVINGALVVDGARFNAAGTGRVLTPA
ncbi:MAG: D-aminoacylase [Candidatus Rokubacteria bacterium]|nr:D-aminoacylase [Candidatus Rokubacteria bacterium]MBI3825136.1 D-aminoacylase [Candidatus Rokubacteria bacterium]